MAHFPRLGIIPFLVITFSFIHGSAAQTAHEPNYSDRKHWPEWVGKTDFINEEWPKTRVLVWALAGQRIRNPDFADPKNWLEKGKPATEPPDKNTDLVFPSGDKGYSINGESSAAARHVTVEKGVVIGVRTFTIHGNVWIKDGASFAHIKLAGDKNTFMRSDGEKPNFAANKIAFNRPADKSVEWMGTWLVNDELDLFSGRFIVAPDSAFLPGDRSMQRIYPSAKLVLHSGATFEKRARQFASTDLAITGELLAGTPERPLTKDCAIGLSAKLKTDARNVKADDRGLLLYKEGKIAVHSADPAKARLVFRLNERPESSYRMTDEEKKRLPSGIDVVLVGATQFNGVVFEDVLEGGIIMRDPELRKNWQHVSYAGDHAESALFRSFSGDPDKMKMDDSGIAGNMVRKGIKPGETASQSDD